MSAQRNDRAGSPVTAPPPERLATRMRRVFRAAVDEATPRLTQFIVRNRSDERLVSPVSMWTDADRQPVSNPVLTAPTIRARSCPKIIFQTWKSRSDIPDNYRYWRDTFLSHNPDHAVILWDDDDNRRFIAESFPWFLRTYDSYPSEIYRADAVRYFFLFQYGGLYADMDTECLKPVDETTEHGDVILCRMGTDCAFPHSLPNAVMASRPGQIFWLHVMRLMLEAREGAAPGRHYGPEEMTGPILLKRAFDQFSKLNSASAWASVRLIRDRLEPEQRRILSHGSIQLLSPRAWYPLDWTNPVHKLLRGQLLSRRQLLPPDVARSLFPRSAVVTYWSHSW